MQVSIRAIVYKYLPRLADIFDIFAGVIWKFCLYSFWSNFWRENEFSANFLAFAMQIAYFIDQSTHFALKTCSQMLIETAPLIAVCRVHQGYVVAMERPNMRY